MPVCYLCKNVAIYCIGGRWYCKVHKPAVKPKLEVAAFVPIQE